MENKTRIQEIRQEKGLSQRQLAKLIDVPNSQISRYENGQHMNEDTVKKICQALEVNADYFLGLVSKKKKTD
jgi:transcriptional regulator with XRE-family HTH domain